jgi:hypothetical protein
MTAEQKQGGKCFVRAKPLSIINRPLPGLARADKASADNKKTPA